MTENRDEAIFCSRCRRPLPILEKQTNPSSSGFLLWLGVFVLLGSIAYLFWFRSPGSNTVTQTDPFLSNASGEMPASGTAATRTEEPVVLRTCVQDNIRIRRLPGTQYETIGGLVTGSCLRILGRNEETSWVFVVGDDGQTGWMDGSLLSDAGDLHKLSVRDHSAAWNTARPTLTGQELAYGAQLYLTNVAATTVPQFPSSRYTVPCFATADRIGDQISCRMERAYCDYLPEVEGSPTVCRDRPYPDQVFTLVVPGEDWSDLDGQCLLVSGYLEVAQGALQIQALQRSQVSACT